MDTKLAASWEGDDLNFVVTVTNTDDTLAKDLTGATVEAKAKKGATTVTGTATVTDAAAGEITVAFTETDLTAGTWNVQVRVTLGTITQTVFDATHPVNISNF